MSFKLPKIETNQLLNKIVKHKSQPDIYEELILALSALGIEASIISFEYRNDSNCAVKCKEDDPNVKSNGYKSVPVLMILVKSYENYYSLNIDPHSNNWDSTYPKTQEIRKMWRDLLIKYNQFTNSTYDNDMLVFFRNVQELVICQLVYKKRNAVIKSITELNVVQPKEIFCCSAPGFNVIYNDEFHYSSAEKNLQFEKIENTINNVISRSVPQEFISDVERYIKIKFYHPGMEGFNWYGFARQD